MFFAECPEATASESVVDNDVIIAKSAHEAARSGEVCIMEIDAGATLHA